MTKADLVNQIYERAIVSKKDAAKTLEMIFDIIRENLENGESINISGFGKFTVREKRARTGRNPRTGEEMEISARRVVTFKPSVVLRKAMSNTPDKTDSE